MRPVTAWQKKTKLCSKCRRFEFHLCRDTFPGFCAIPPPRTAFQKKEHSCSSLLLTPIKVELGMRPRGIRPQDFEWRKETEWDPSTTLFYTSRGWNRGTEEWTRHFSSFPALHLLAPDCGEIIQSGSHPFGQSRGQNSAVSPGCERRADFTGPLGQKLHLSYVRVTTVAKV